MPRHFEPLLRAIRWLMLPFFLGLSFVLVLFVAQFFLDIWRLGAALVAGQELHLTRAALSLLDIVLMAVLVLIVMLSGFEALARSRGTAERASTVWLIGVGTIKVRIMSAIVVISAIDLLEIFYDTSHVATDRILWLIALHITFVVTAVLLAVIDWLASLTR